MSNPDKAATPAEDVTKQVSEVITSITTDEDGNYVFPENEELTPELKFAATAEKRRRDTQQAFTKNQQSLKALEAEKAKLLEELAVVNKPSFTDEEQAELDSLKYEDPDAWRVKLNTLEKQKLQEANAKLNTLTGEAKQAAELEFELSRRAQVLKEFNKTTSTPITDEIIENEIPPRITRKLEKGLLTFEGFLEEVNKYLNTNKVVKNSDTLEQPNLGAVVGSNTPKDEKPTETASKKYKQMVF